MTDSNIKTTLRRGWITLPLLIPLVFFLYVGNGGIDLGPRLNRITGYGGIDFGKHWDEPLLLGDIKGSLQNRLLLPTAVCNYEQYDGLHGGNYEYPSVLYWIGLAVAAPEIRHTAIGPAPAIDTKFVDETVHDSNGNPVTNLYSIHLRQACLLISSLTILFVGWLTIRLVRKENEPGSGGLAGLIAASILATSWQFSYHSRWIAPDEIMTVFSTVCLALCVVATQKRSTHAVIWAAVFAGLATGIKYPGGLLLVPVLTAGWFARPRTFLRRALRSIELIAIVSAVFVITTPGAITQPWNFVAWIKFDRFHYGQLGHYGHDIRNHVAMAMAMGEYLLFKLPSQLPGISIGVCALAVIGAVALIFRSWRVAVVLLPFPVIYFGYFSQQIVLIVRNLLILAPIGAALAAVGAVTIADLFSRPGRFFGWAVVVIVFSAIAWDAAWVQYASESMPQRRSADWQVRQLEKFAENHPDLRIFPSENVQKETGWPLVPAANPGARDVVVTFAMEDGDAWLWPANIPGMTIATFGSYCVDFDSYPNWEDNRIVMMEVSQARRVPVGHVERIVRRRDLSNASQDQKLLVYMGCGSTPQVDGNGVRIKAVRGAGYPCQFDVGVPQPDARGIEADDSLIVYEISGLDPKKSYGIGWSWWDWNTAHRIESAWVVSGGGPLIDGDSAGWIRLSDPTRLPAWPLVVNPVKHKLSSMWPPPYAPRTGVAGHADYAVPLPAGSHGNGMLRFAVKKESGPDVVVSGLWITQVN